MAEGLFRGVVGDGEMAVSSAGVAAYGGGEASPETVDILRARGLALDGFGSRMVDADIIGEATHVFCMTRGHMQALESIFPEQRDKFYLVCEFAEIDGVVGRDVPDPIGGGPGAYEEVAETLDRAIEGIVGFLRASRGSGSE